MACQIANRLKEIKPSPTLSLNATAKAMSAAGEDVINLTVGEPDFMTPAQICERAKAAIDEGHHKYTPADGVPALKEAIINKLQRDNQLTYAANEVIVNCGAKHTLFNAIMASMNDGDEAIIPVPYWVSYPAMVHMAGAKPVLVEASFEQHFKITAAQLEAAITDKTRLFILNSPSNPSGMVYSRSELESIANVLLKHPEILILSDDIYETLIYPPHVFTHILSIAPELRDRTVVINGVSKSHCMTGWRLGYAAGPSELIAAMKKMQSHSTSNPCAITQQAAITALEMTADDRADMLATFTERLAFAHQKISTIPGIECHQAQGAFYIFANIQQAITRKQLADDITFCAALLEQEKVAVVPGAAFGMPGHFRMSAAIDQARIDEALNRINRFISP